MRFVGRRGGRGVWGVEGGVLWERVSAEGVGGVGKAGGEGVEGT